MPDNSSLVLDFSTYITDRTRDFTGRKWVFDEIDKWLATPDAPHMLIITGEPGIGKTSIAAQLTRFSTGVKVPQTNYVYIGTGFLSAFHFCSARNGGWISPDSFTRSLSTQLSFRYPAFAQALGMNPQIHVEQSIVKNMGTAI